MWSSTASDSSGSKAKRAFDAAQGGDEDAVDPERVARFDAPLVDARRALDEVGVRVEQVVANVGDRPLRCIDDSFPERRIDSLQRIGRIEGEHGVCEDAKAVTDVVLLPVDSFVGAVERVSLSPSTPVVLCCEEESGGTEDVIPAFVGPNTRFDRGQPRLRDARDVARVGVGVAVVRVARERDRPVTVGRIDEVVQHVEVERRVVEGCRRRIVKCRVCCIFCHLSGR